MSYKKWEIWVLAKEISNEIHRMSLALPEFEQSEAARQIRKSSKNVRSTIVRGYASRHSKSDFIRCIARALASTMETLDHLEALHETGSLNDEYEFVRLRAEINLLGKRLDAFLESMRHLGLSQMPGLSVSCNIPVSPLQYLLIKG